MIGKVAHPVRILHHHHDHRTEFYCFVEAVRAEYYELITTRLVRGTSFGLSLKRRSQPAALITKRVHRAITEKVNELVVAKVLLDDKTITGPNRLSAGRAEDRLCGQSRCRQSLCRSEDVCGPLAPIRMQRGSDFFDRRKLHAENVELLISWW